MPGCPVHASSTKLAEWGLRRPETRSQEASTESNPPNRPSGRLAEARNASAFSYTIRWSSVGCVGLTRFVKRPMRAQPKRIGFLQRHSPQFNACLQAIASHVYTCCADCYSYGPATSSLIRLRGPVTTINSVFQVNASHRDVFSYSSPIVACRYVSLLPKNYKKKNRFSLSNSRFKAENCFSLQFG